MIILNFIYAVLFIGLPIAILILTDKIKNGLLSLIAFTGLAYLYYNFMVKSGPYVNNANSKILTFCLFAGLFIMPIGLIIDSIIKFRRAEAIFLSKN